MIKGIIGILVLSTLFQVPYSSYRIDESEKSTEVEIVSPNEILKLEEILQDSSGALSEQEKARLQEVKAKIESYEAITQEELDFIRECDLNIIKKKLGEAEFNEYCKLIKKRASKDEFSQDERIRLFQLEKKIKGIN